MATTSPSWITPPQTRWLACAVEGYLEPNEYAVQIRVNGHEVAAAVSRDYVKAPAKLPNAGSIMVVVVAHLSDDNVLADLPATPLNGTRRITVDSKRLLD